MSAGHKRHGMPDVPKGAFSKALEESSRQREPDFSFDHFWWPLVLGIMLGVIAWEVIRGF